MHDADLVLAEKIVEQPQGYCLYAMVPGHPFAGWQVQENWQVQEDSE